MTNTPETTKKFEVPNWAWRVGGMLLVISFFQLPKISNSYRQGVRAGNVFCTAVTNGDSPNQALKAVSTEMGDEKYSKAYGTFVTMGMRNKVQDCPAVKSAVANRLWN